MWIKSEKNERQSCQQSFHSFYLVISKTHFTQIIQNFRIPSVHPESTIHGAVTQLKEKKSEMFRLRLQCLNKH